MLIVNALRLFRVQARCVGGVCWQTQIQFASRNQRDHIGWHGPKPTIEPETLSEADRGGSGYLPLPININRRGKACAVGGTSQPSKRSTSMISRCEELRILVGSTFFVFATFRLPAWRKFGCTSMLKYTWFVGFNFTAKSGWNKHLKHQHHPEVLHEQG